MSPATDYSGGISRGRHNLVRVLGEAKSNLYEAHVIAKEESMAEMAERAWEVFNLAERLFLDERKGQWGINDATEAEWAAAFGPRYRT